MIECFSDAPVRGMAIIVVVSLALFAPTLVAHFRGLSSFRSISALNALVLLFAVAFIAPGMLLTGLSPQIVWIVGILWLMDLTLVLAKKGN